PGAPEQIGNQRAQLVRITRIERARHRGLSHLRHRREHTGARRARRRVRDRTLVAREASGGQRPSLAREQPSRMRRIPIFLLFAAICTSALTARADPTTYTPPVPSGVQGKLYRMSNRWAVGRSFLAAVNTPLVARCGCMLS